MSATGTYRVDESGALVQCDERDPGARQINWSITNHEIAVAFGVTSIAVARARPADWCSDVEDFHGRVGVKGRILPDVEVAPAKPSGKAKAKPVTTKSVS